MLAEQKNPHGILENKNKNGESCSQLIIGEDA
jgi:hypothetical protein